MKTVFLIAFMILASVFTGRLHSQIPNIKNQCGFEYRLLDYLDTIGFKKPNFRIVNCEFRIWQNNYSTGQNKLIQLRLQKDGNWKGKSLEYYCYNSNSCDMGNFIIDTLKISESWKKSWITIVDSNFINVETQRKVNEKIKNEFNDDLRIADGNGYVFEIITRKAKRSFRYQNALAYKDFYQKHGIESESYEKIVQLINLIEKEFGAEYKIKAGED